MMSEKPDLYAGRDMTMNEFCEEASLWLRNRKAEPTLILVTEDDHGTICSTSTDIRTNEINEVKYFKGRLLINAMGFGMDVPLPEDTIISKSVDEHDEYFSILYEFSFGGSAATLQVIISKPDIDEEDFDEDE